MKKYLSSIVISVLLFSGCSTVILVRSLRENNSITIDGNEKDWNDRTFYLNEQNLSLGVRNDADNFYLFIKVLDHQQIRNIRAAGLTVWLDPTGDNEKEYGFRIPGKPFRSGEMQEDDFERMPNDINEVEIITKDKKKPLQIPVAQLKGMQFATSRTPESLIFEFKFPLKENSENPFQWNVMSNEIGVTLESGKMERPNKEGMKTEFDRSQDEEARPGMGVNESGERGGERRGRSHADFKPENKNVQLDFWFKLRLAEIQK